MKVDRLSTDGKLFGGDKSFVLIKVGRVSNNGDRVFSEKGEKVAVISSLVPLWQHPDES